MSILLFVQVSGAIISFVLGIMWLYKEMGSGNSSSNVDEPTQINPTTGLPVKKKAAKKKTAVKPKDTSLVYYVVGALATIAVAISAVLYHAFNKDVIDKEPIPQDKNVQLTEKLVAAFANSKETDKDTRLDAYKFGLVCREVSRDLKMDGDLDEKSIIKTGIQIAQFRNSLRMFALDGRSLGAAYPDLVNVIQEYLDATAGKSAQELSPEQRTKWVDSLEVLGISSLNASTKL